MDNHATMPSGSSSSKSVITAFLDLSKDADIALLHELVNITQAKIVSLSVPSTPTNISNSELSTLFDYVPNVINEVSVNESGHLLVQGEANTSLSETDLLVQLRSELDSMNLLENTPSPTVKTQWLMEPETSAAITSLWHRGNPTDINQYPGICKLREIINNLPQCVGKMNGCIVNCFGKDSVRHRPHSDDEDYTDQCSSICTFSLGATRDFGIYTKNHRKPELLKTMTLKSNSVSFMQPGSQAKSKHRILPATSLDSEYVGPRYSISFRNIKPSKAEDSKESPRPENARDSQQKSLKQTTLIFGSSIPKRLDSKKLSGKSNKVVINLSHSGGKIIDVCKDMDDFFLGTHEYFKSESALKRDELVIENVILSVGTNDILRIREANNVNRLYLPVEKMLRKAKDLFHCKIVMQGVIPIPSQPDDIRRGTIRFNDMVQRICQRQRCYFMDLWDNFLDCQKFSRFYVLRRDGYCDIHPNKEGMSILARAYIRVIRNYFDPYIRS